MKKIESKIKTSKVMEKGSPVEPAPNLETPREEMHEKVDRHEVLSGSTYKIKPPTGENALYITINNITLNPGTEYEETRPFEIFINSKNLDQFQWVVALTRVISAVFRKGGDVIFLVEELGAVFDPQGGYFKKGGKFIPSLVAEIGEVLKQHLTTIGLIKEEELSDTVKAVLEEKKEQLGLSSGEYPASASICGKCNTKAVMVLDGCSTCLSCGDSKCG